LRLDDLTIEVRNAALQRVGQLTPDNLVGFSAVLMKNSVGSWKVTLPVGYALAEALRAPGSGIIVTAAGQTLISGPTMTILTNRSQEDPVGTYEISGVDDSIVLSERLAYPTPTTADVMAQTSAYDVRTGAAETVIKGYVNANIGPSAPVARRIASLTVQASSGLGVSVDGSARFETLQDLLTGFADLSGLGFTIEQVGDVLQFQVYEPVDRSSYVRLDLDNGRLTRSDYAYSTPKLTRAIVGGQGEGELRDFIERTSADSLGAEALWGRRIEQFVDNRSGIDVTELEQAGDKELVTNGKTFVSVDVMPSDDQTMLFGVDWNLGDRVTVVVGTTELVAVVEKVALLISEDGVRLGATVGEPRGLSYENQLVNAQKDQVLRVSKLERI
jgi:hypothetical protein